LVRMIAIKIRVCGMLQGGFASNVRVQENVIHATG